MPRVPEDVREALAQLLNAVRDLPIVAKPTSNRYASVGLAETRQIYHRFNIELDELAPGIGRLLRAEGPVPSAARAWLIVTIRGLLDGPADSLEVFRTDGNLDPKAKSILAALARPADSLEEIAERTRNPKVSLSTVKKLSKKLQHAGLIARDAQGMWVRG